MPFGFGDALDDIRASVRDLSIRVRADALERAEELWQRVSQSQLGVSAADPDGHKIGMNVAYRSGVGLNWYPADPYKQVLVGLVDRYGFYDGWGDEGDWNIYIKPDPPFAFLIDDTLSNADLEDVHKCQSPSLAGAYCMEAEITPDENFYGNPYFPKNGPSPLVGQRIGVYGPWVMEEAHGWRPEIHPSEVLWWRDTNQATGFHTWTVLVVQDDSNRFDRSSDYRGRVPRPWSACPRHAIVDFAIEVPAGAPTRRLEIREIYGRNVLASDPGGSPQTSATANGQSIAVVDKQLGDLTHVRAQFGAFRTVASGARHGFLRLNVGVGVNDRGGEGYLVLEVKETA